MWVLLAGFCVILYAAWQLSAEIATGSFKALLVLAASFVAFFILARIARDWRSGVYFFLVWLLFEDLLRKYMGNNMAVYFVKDALVAVTYLSILSDRTRNSALLFRPPFVYSLGMFLILAVTQVFNPHSPSIFYGILGLKLYFYYVPLMFVGYAILRTVEDLRKFLTVTMFVAAIISVVGIIQSLVGIDFLNPRGSGEDIEVLGHLVRQTSQGLEVLRPPSVFVSDGRFSEYLVVVFILGLCAAGFLLLRAGRGRKIIFPALGLVALASTLAGGRGAFAYVLASAVLLPLGFIWGAPQRVGAAYRLVKAIRRGFAFMAVAIALGVLILPGVVSAHYDFYRESLMPNSEYSQTTERAWDYPAQEMEKAFDDPNWVIGHGVGTGSLGVQYVSRILQVPSADVGVENGFGIILLELGILGPILWLIWSGSLFFSACRTVLKLKGTWAFPLALGITWFTFVLLFAMTWGSMVHYQNFVVNAYFWLMVGILFRLPGLVKEDEAAVAAVGEGMVIAQ